MGVSIVYMKSAAMFAVVVREEYSKVVLLTAIYIIRTVNVLIDHLAYSLAPLKRERVGWVGDGAEKRPQPS